MVAELLISPMTTPHGATPKDFVLLASPRAFVRTPELRRVEQYVGSKGWAAGEFLFQSGGDVYAGKSAWTRSILGDGHRFSFQHGGHESAARRGRPNPFLYAARVSDMEAIPTRDELSLAVGNRLEPLLTEAHGASSLPISPANSLGFNGSKDGEWGRIAEEIRAGKHSGRIAFWRDGHGLEWLDVEKNVAGGAQHAERVGAQAGGAGKAGASVGKPPGAVNSKTITAVVAGACLVGLAVWAMNAWGQSSEKGAAAHRQR